MTFKATLLLALIWLFTRISLVLCGMAELLTASSRRLNNLSQLLMNIVKKEWR